LEHAAPDQPVDAHWLPSQLLTVEVLRRLLEFTLQASARVVASLLGAAAKASSPVPWLSSSGSRWTPGG
jgi:hypothetical protein